MTGANEVRVNDASVVSVEVTGRQRYIFESDKLQEMLGASRLIRATVNEAVRLFGPPDGTGTTHLFQPLSGEIRAWSLKADRSKLLDKAWQLRAWLQKKGIEHTVSYCEVPAVWLTSPDPSRQGGIGGVRRELEVAGRAVALRVESTDARPACSLFASCQIHPWDSANEWQPGSAEEDEERRDLIGYRALEKRKEWRAGVRAFREEELVEPLRARLEKLGLREDALTIAGDFRDLTEQDESLRNQDQYLAFICADGDGLGASLRRVRWNAANWGDAAAAEPWIRNALVTRAIATCADNAFSAAVAETVFPDEKSARVYAARKEAGKKLPLPVIPQLIGGDDFWAVTRRDVALDLAIRFSGEFTEQTKNSPDLRAAFTSDGTQYHGLTLSVGIAFAKRGYPADAMAEAAEDLLGSAKARAKRQTQLPARGALDWFWIASSLSEPVMDSRHRDCLYVDDSSGTTIELSLTSLPWTIPQTEQMLIAARQLYDRQRSDVDDGPGQRAPLGLSRRKREQIEPILRRGYELSLLAWEGWLKSLTVDERKTLARVVDALAAASITMKPLRAGDDAGQYMNPWIERDEEGRRFYTPWVDLVNLFDVLRSREDEDQRSEREA